MLFALTDPDHRNIVFDQSRLERFQKWSTYKTHLVLPLGRDIPLRFFDSLLCGQIPIVPFDCPDLNQVISQEIQDYLPVIRFDEKDEAAILAAHRIAVECFDADGSAGIVRRRDYAINNHHVAVRIGQIASYLHSVACAGSPSTITFNDKMTKWSLDDI